MTTKFFAIGLAGLVLAGMLCVDVGAPWNDEGPGMLGAFYSIAARNYLRHGSTDTLLAPILTTGDVRARDNKRIYLHHPPAMPLLISFSFRLLGEAEAAARIIPIAFTLGSFVLTVLLARQLWPGRVPVFAAWGFALAPMATFYGSLVDVQCTGPRLFSLLMLWFYLRWRELPGKGLKPLVQSYRVRMGLCFAGGMLFDWPPALLVAALLVHSVACPARGRSRLGLVPFAAFAFAFASGVVIWCEYAEEWTGLPTTLGSSLLGALAGRAGSVPSNTTGAAGFTWLEFAGRQAEHLGALYTRPAIGLSGVWLVVFARNSLRNRRVCERDFLIACLGMFGLLYILLFREGAYIHPFWGFYLLPFFALSTARGLEEVGQALGRRRAALATVGPAILLAAIAADGVYVSLSLRAKTRTYTSYKMIGPWLRQHTDARSVIYVAGHLPWQARYYSDRIIRFGAGSRRRLARLMARDKRTGYVPAVLLVEDATTTGSPIPGYRVYERDGLEARIAARQGRRTGAIKGIRRTGPGAAPPSRGQ